jgi:hypothetical protein
MIPAVKKLAVYAGTFIILTSAGGMAWAGQVGALTQFQGGQTAVAADVNGNFAAVKTEVNANETRLTTLEGQNLNTRTTTLEGTVNNGTTGVGALNTTVGTHATDITNLKGNLTGPTCVTNNGSDVMVRVGPLCVDRYRASLWPDKNAGGSQITSIPVSCKTDGKSCSGIVAQSRASVTPIDGSVITWAQAQAACTNAGKRLLTPGEWLAAYSNGQIPELSTIGKQEYVDLVALTYGAASPGLVQVGYIGPTDDAANPGVPGNPGLNAGSNGFTYDIVAALPNIFGFRCAR